MNCPRCQRPLPSSAIVCPVCSVERARPPATPAAGRAGATIGVLALLGGLLLKGKGVLLGLFKLKSLLVVLKSGGSMLLMIGVYALAWPWTFAVGFALLLLVHELGHALVLRALGIRFRAPIFIPFVGAFIGLKEMPPDAGKEALVAFGGPFLGTIGAQVCLVLHDHYGAPVLLGLAQIGYLLNLFNLIPYSPLDGGRIVGAISPRLWLLALPLLVLAGLYLHSIMLAVIGLLGLPRAIAAWRARKQPAAAVPEGYYKLKPSTRLWAAAGYLGLAAFLALMMQHVHGITPPR
jgi:Zn-dependent protease